MNPDILKQIIEAVNGMAGNAKEAFGYYLLADYGVDLLKFILGWIGGLSLAYLILSRTLHPLITNMRASLYLCQIRDRFGLGSEGPLSDAELSRVKQTIERALTENNVKP